MNSEVEPFLPGSDHGVDEKHWHCECCERKRTHIKIYIAAIVLQLLTILSLGWTLAKTLSTAPGEGRSVQSVASFAPAHDAVEYRIDTPPQNFWENELYVQPSYESDYAWNDLMDNQTTRLSSEEAAQLQLEAAPLPGQGHAAMFGVYHNLHCLRRIRQTMFVDYYYPNRTDEQKELDNHHAYHCLEAVRSSVMCYPDLTLHPLVWGDIKGHPLLASPNVPRKCVDWGKLMEWSSTRHYTYADIEAAMKEAGREIPS